MPLDMRTIERARIVCLMWYRTVKRHRHALSPSKAQIWVTGVKAAIDRRKGAAEVWWEDVGCFGKTAFDVQLHCDIIQTSLNKDWIRGGCVERLERGR